MPALCRYNGIGNTSAEKKQGKNPLLIMAKNMVQNRC